mgnify:CR=1 FL=1
MAPFTLWPSSRPITPPKSELLRASRSKATTRTNAAKSSIRAHVEHVFAHQKNRFGLYIRTIGLARAEAKLTLCNLAYNFSRLIFHERRESRG